MGKKIIYYFTQYNDKPVDIKAIASKIKVPSKTVEQKIEKLYTAARYYTFNDITLMRFIKFVYEQDLEGVDDIDLSQQNLMNTLSVQFLEMVVEVTMMKFNHELMPGSWFGRTGQVEVPLFQFVKTTSVKASKTKTYQIDVFGKEEKRHKVWLCECKYTKTKMDLTQVQKLESAAQVLIKTYEEEGTSVPEIHLLLVSTGGFTSKVLTYIESRADIYYSDYGGINQLFKAYGGNYSIPQFAENDG